MEVQQDAICIASGNNGPFSRKASEIDRLEYDIARNQPYGTDLVESLASFTPLYGRGFELSNAYDPDLVLTHQHTSITVAENRTPNRTTNPFLVCILLDRRRCLDCSCGRLAAECKFKVLPGELDTFEVLGTLHACER